MKPHVYVSIPMNTDLEKIKIAAKLILDAGGEPYRWYSGDHYNRSIMDKADIVVAIIGGNQNSFSLLKQNISKGTREEILYAIQQQKRVYILYQSNEGYGLYLAKATDVSIAGLQGTRDYFRQQVEAIKLGIPLDDKHIKQLIERDPLGYNESKFCNLEHEQFEKLCMDKGFDNLSLYIKEQLTWYRNRFRKLIDEGTVITKYNPETGEEIVKRWTKEGHNSQNIPAIPSNKQLEEMFPFIPKDEIETVLLLLR